MLEPTTIDAIRRHIAWIPQELALPSEWVKEMISLPFALKANRHISFSEEKLFTCFDELGLDKELYQKRVGEISGGQRQRVAIARALSLNPDAIIADEPTSALDVSVRAQILNLLTDLKKELGLAMVFISHDIQTVRYISDDIIVMNGGKIVEQGEAKQVFQHPQDPYTKMLLGAAPSLLHPKLGE